jgi:hypothetical protein
VSFSVLSLPTFRSWPPSTDRLYESHPGENSTLKRIFTPILGLALLYGIYSYLTARESDVREVASI